MTKTRRRQRQRGGVLDTNLLTALTKAGVQTQAAHVLATTLLTTVAAYDSSASVAKMAREGACRIANATPSSAKKGGFLGYTVPTAAMTAAAAGITQAARVVLQNAGVDERTLNLALYSIPCLLNILPAALNIPVPGYSYAPA